MLSAWYVCMIWEQTGRGSPCSPTIGTRRTNPSSAGWGSSRRPSLSLTGRAGRQPKRKERPKPRPRTTRGISPACTRCCSSIGCANCLTVAHPHVAACAFVRSRWLNAVAELPWPHGDDTTGGAARSAGAAGGGAGGPATQEPHLHQRRQPTGPVAGGARARLAGRQPRRHAVTPGVAVAGRADGRGGGGGGGQSTLRAGGHRVFVRRHASGGTRYAAQPLEGPGAASRHPGEAPSRFSRETESPGQSDPVALASSRLAPRSPIHNTASVSPPASYPSCSRPRLVSAQ